MINTKSLTTKEVARLCRVSDATVKRWEDAGLIRSERTNGGHRRFRAEEIIRFQRECGLGLKQCHGDESATKAKTERRPQKALSGSQLFQALLAGREEEAANVLINAHLQGKSLTTVFDEMLSPALRQIGELWFNGDVSIAQEHLASRVTLTALYKLRNVLPVPEMTDRLAVCCAIEGDFHELPTHMAQMTLENAGIEVVNFGAATPLYSLTEEILHYSPALVCMSATVMSDIDRLARDYREFRSRTAKLKFAVVLGGQLFDEECMQSRFPADLYPQTFAELAEFVRANVIDKE